MKRLSALVLLLLAFLVAGGCITDPVTGGSVLGMPMSDAEESEIGVAYKPMIVQEYGGPYPDAELHRHLEGIVLPMARQSVRPDLPWTFTVLNTSVPNAFAVPGGQVFVTRGMLVRMEDEAEFAVVMGHELGHVEHRHGVQAIGRQQLFAGLGTAVELGFGEEVGQPTAAVLQFVELGYSREQENESDARGVEASYRSGYDPREGADVFRMFLAMKQEMGDSTPWYLSTHPADEERIANVLSMSAQKDSRLAGTGDVAGFRRTTPEWTRLITRLRNEQQTYDRYDRALASVAESKGAQEAASAAVSTLEACARELPGHALIVASLGKVRAVAGDIAGAKTDLARAASMDQGLVEPEWILGVVAIDEKRWDDAARHAEKGLSILPGNYQCLAIRGEARWNLGRRAEAQADFQQVLESAPNGSEEQRLAQSRIQETEPAPRKRRAKR